MNTELLTASHPTDKEILNSVMDQNEDQQSHSYSKNKDVIPPRPKRTEMIQSFEIVGRGFQMEENVPDYF